MITTYSLLVFFHLLLFVFWLGGDLGVAILGEHFRKRKYSIEERVTILRLLIINDLGPRIAWALMIPSTISLLFAGGYWALPLWAVLLAWGVGAFWVWLVIAGHKADQTPKGKTLKKIEYWLKWALCLFYLGLGGISLATDAPLAENWLASKALLFGLIFVAAIMIDVMFKPLGGPLMRLITEGSSDETEKPVLVIMNRTRLWVRIVYVLLVVTAFLGNTKAF